MQIRKVTAKSAELVLVKRLYESAFPANERWGLEAVLCDQTGISEMLCFFDGEIFCGFVIMLHYDNYSHIIYFAIEDALRSHGYGSEAIRLIRERMPERTIMVDIEREAPGADNNEQRRRRKAFYLRNGYHEAQVYYDWRGERYEIVILGGEITSREYFRFWHNIDEHSEIFGR